MTEYLVAARAAIILWTNLAVMPAEILFDAIEPNWSAAASRRTLSFIVGQRERGARNDKTHCTVTESRWIIASS